jgi:dihydroorotase-like cyclic amidohydrolase
VLVKSLQARYRGDTWLDYYRSRPEEAEIRAVRNALREARTVGAALHIVHVATAEAAGLIREDPDVSAETAPHYLEFCTEDLERIGSALKTAPVVKPAGNREKLWEYLADGTLDFVASDHAPAPAEQKNTGSPRRDYAGIPGTGTIFPYCYSEGFVKRGIPLPRFLKITAENAAKRYRLFDRKASIETGKDADLIFVDPAGERVIRGKDLYSKGKITPFENMTLRGRIIKTMLRGDIVYDNEKGITANAGCGRFLKPGDAPELSPCQENIRGEQDHA